MDSIKLLSMNVRGLGNNEKCAAVFQFFKENKYSIMCLQETHSHLNVMSKWCKEWGCEIIFSHGASNARGTAILVHKSIKDCVMPICNSQFGRYNIVHIEIKELSFILCNIYGPNVDDESTFKEMFIDIKELQYARDLIIIGDYNVTLNLEQDRTENTQPHPKIAMFLNDKIEELDLIDPWRVRNPQKIVYFWQRFFNKLCASRIDYALVTPGLNNSILQTQYVNGIRTDHQGVEINIVCNNQKRGPGIWRINNLILNDEVYCQQLIDVIQSVKKECTNVDPVTKWEQIKNKVIIFTQNFAKRKAAEKNMILKNANTRLAQIQTIIHNGHATLDEINEYGNLKTVVDDIYMDHAQSAAFRARANWAGEGEKNTKYFFSLEKANFKRKTMTILRKDCGEITQDAKEILELQKQFYENLYTSDPRIQFNLINQSNIRIPEDVAQALENGLTISELKNALFNLKCNKVPGCDGLSINWYCKFWDIIKTEFYEMTQYAMETGKMPESAMKGCISLLPKKSCDPLQLKNWRPLTLLNNDYKIISKALAI